MLVRPRQNAELSCARDVFRALSGRFSLRFSLQDPRSRTLRARAKALRRPPAPASEEGDLSEIYHPAMKNRTGLFMFFRPISLLEPKELRVSPTLTPAAIWLQRARTFRVQPLSSAPTFRPLTPANTHNKHL